MCTLVPVAFVLMFMGVCTFIISKRFLYLKCENAETVIENHSPWTFQQSQTITDNLYVIIKHPLPKQFLLRTSQCVLLQNVQLIFSHLSSFYANTNKTKSESLKVFCNWVILNILISQWLHGSETMRVAD